MLRLFLGILILALPICALPSQQLGQRLVASTSLRRFQEKKLHSSSSKMKLHSHDDDKLIRITSEIKLPFSAEVAYEAYSDLPRQPSWSSWLESVTVLENGESKWTSKVMGIRYSWTAEAVANIKPHTIQWRSVTGLRNEGTVQFFPLEGKNYDQGPTLMTLQMAFGLPTAVRAIVKRSKRVSKFVEETMIAQSLQDFRDTVEEEIKIKPSRSWR